MSRFINIHGLKVPNPRAMKFEAEGLLLTHGAYEYADAESAKVSPLAATLFKFPYVERVFIAKNYITVTKKDEMNPIWDQVLPEIRIVIRKYLETGAPIFNFDLPGPEEEVYPPDMEGALRKMMNEKIRPATNQDGGDITFESYEDGVLKVKLAGACVECPFAPRTIKSGIEKLARSLFPEVQAVTSDDVDWSDTQQEG